MAIVTGKTYLMGTGAAGTITYPTQGTNPGKWTLCRLTNASAFPVLLRLGGIYLDTLPAWTANVYPLLQAGDAQGIVSGSPPTLSYVCITPANPPPTGVGDSTLYTDFGLFGDTFPGSYPQPLAGQAIASAVSGAVALSVFNIGQLAYVISPPNTSGTFTIPANTHTIRIFSTESGVSTTWSLFAVGVQSGISYPVIFAQSNIGQNNAIATIPFGGTAIDSQITFTVSGATGAGTLYIIGTSDPALLPVEITNEPAVFDIPYYGVNANASAQVGSAGTTTLLTVPGGATWHINNLSLSLTGTGGQGNVSGGGYGQLIGHFAPATAEKQFEGGLPITGPTTLTLSTTTGIQGLATVQYSTVLSH